MVNCKRKLKSADHFQNLLDFAKGTKKFQCKFAKLCSVRTTFIVSLKLKPTKQMQRIYKETEQHLSSAWVLPKIINANFMTSQVLDPP